MRDRLDLLACAGPTTLARILLLSGAVAKHGGRVVVLTYTPGLALRHTFFGLEVVVRREDDLSADLFRLESLALSRGAGVVLLDDDRLSDEHVAPVRVLSEQLAVARYGPHLAGGAAGELAIDPFHDAAAATNEHPRADRRSRSLGPLALGGCFGLTYLPLHPALRPLRDRRRALGALAVPAAVHQVTILCRGPTPAAIIPTMTQAPTRPPTLHDETDEPELAAQALGALSALRPGLQVTVLHPADLPASGRAALSRAAQHSPHQVAVRPIANGDAPGEELLCDLAIVDDPDSATVAAYLGTPSVILSRDESAALRSEVLAQKGVALHLPASAPDGLRQTRLAEVVALLCADPGQRAALAATASRVVDGLGSERIAAALLDLQQSRRRR